MKKIRVIFLLFIFIFSIVYAYDKSLILRYIDGDIILMLKGKRTVKKVISNIKKRIKKGELTNLKNLKLDKFKKMYFLIFKKELKTEVWFETKDNSKIYGYTLDIKGSSGKLGPKLVEGDEQIPEGIYDITHLHPNSVFGISLKVGYPNEADKVRSRKNGIKNYGNDIFIHNTSATIGCIPLGEMFKVEELFYMSYKLGLQNVKAIFSPIDFRKGDFNTKFEKDLNTKFSKLYELLRKELIKFKIQ